MEDKVTRQLPLSDSSEVTRRRVLGTAALGFALAACAPAAAPATGEPSPGGGPKPAPASEATDRWDKLVAAARQEGKVVVNFTGAGSGYRKIGEAFEAAFPGIQAEITSFGSSRQWTPKVVQEWEAGIVSWDVTQIAINDIVETLHPKGIMAPIKPVIFRPDVLDSNAWHNGYDWGYLDPDRQLGFGFGWRKLSTLWVNTDLIKPEEVKSVKDLLDPKWKGKFLFADPRTSGFTIAPATAMRMKLGPQIIKQLFVDQEPVSHRDVRFITEQLVRGRFALASGVQKPVLDEFLAQGLGQNVKPIDLQEAFVVSCVQLWLLNRAPHPNAAALFINWFLTKEGQAVFSSNVKENSRRKDVPVADPPTAVDPTRKIELIQGGVEFLKEFQETESMLRDLLK